MEHLGSRHKNKILTESLWGLLGDLFFMGRGAPVKGSSQMQKITEKDKVRASLTGLKS